MPILSLEVRVKERYEECERMIEGEKRAQVYADKLKDLFPSHCLAISVYEKTCYLYVFLPKEMTDEFEANLMEIVASRLDSKWERDVLDKQVRYTMMAYDKDQSYTGHLIVNLLVPDSCTIVAIATGKMVKVSKYVEVEIPEVEYKVDCSGIE